MRLGLLGGTGQVGTELIALAHAAGWTTSAPSSTELDVTNESALMKWVDNAQPELLVSCAAFTAVDSAEIERERAFAVNGDAPGFMGVAANSARIPVIHLSTDYVFSGDSASAYSERDATGPLNVYGASKLAGEVTLRRSAKSSFIMRVSWVFSAHGRNFVKAILHRARTTPELSVVDDQVGGPCSAHSIARTIMTLAPRVRFDGKHQLYHYASYPFVSWHSFATAIVEGAVARGLIAKAPPVRAISSSEFPSNARRPTNSRLDASALERDFGIEPGDWRRELDAVLDQLAKSGA